MLYEPSDLRFRMLETWHLWLPAAVLLALALFIVVTRIRLAEPACAVRHALARWAMSYDPSPRHAILFLAGHPRRHALLRARLKQGVAVDGPHGAALPFVLVSTETDDVPAVGRILHDTHAYGRAIMEWRGHDTAAQFTTATAAFAWLPVDRIDVLTDEDHAPRVRAIARLWRVAFWLGLTAAPVVTVTTCPGAGRREPVRAIVRDVLRMAVWLVTDWLPPDRRPRPEWHKRVAACEREARRLYPEFTA